LADHADLTTCRDEKAGNHVSALLFANTVWRHTSLSWPRSFLLAPTQIPLAFTNLPYIS
jgi:hypothetical protein